MTLSRNPANYEHIQRVLDAALPHEKVIFKCADVKTAIRWRQEAYFFRSICGHQRYATLMLQLDGDKVIIGRRKIDGVLMMPDGKVLAPGKSDLESEEEKAAYALASRLGLDVED